MRHLLCTATATACLLASASLLAAAPRWVRVTVPGQDAATSEVVAWNTDSASDPSTVQYGTSASALTQASSGKATAYKGKLGAVHEVTLTGLQPGTTYHYRVGGGQDWSPVHHFTTAPLPGCAPFTFIASGDHRSDDAAGPNPKWESILGEMASSGARFVLETGDLVHDGNDLQQWWNHMEMAAKHTGELALMPGFGNHDSDDVEGASAAFNQIFALPTNDSSGTEDFYAFTYGNAVFVALSTATYDDQAGLAQQAKWLDQTLTQHADKQWKFVFFHHPCYTSSIDLKIIDLNHPADEKGQNAHFVPVFDKHHVDVVFAGHNHFYERFAPMKGGKVVGSPADGTVYVTTGGAGAFTYDTIDLFGLKIEPMKVICGDGILGMSGKATGSQACSGKHHYIELTLDQNNLTAKVLATAAQNLSTGDKNKAVIDTFTLTKAPVPPPVACGTTGGADAGSTDGGSADAGSTDAGTTADATTGDATTADSTTADATTADTGAAEDVPAAQDSATDQDLAPAPDTAAAGTDAAATEGTDAAAGADADAGAPQATDTGGTLPGTLDAGTGPAGQAASGAKASGCAAAGPSGQGGTAALLLGMLLAVGLLRRRVVG